MASDSEQGIQPPLPDGAKRAWWKRRWVKVVGLVFLLLVVVAALSDDSDDDKESGPASTDVDDESNDSDDADEEATTTVDPRNGSRDEPWPFEVATAVTFDTFGDADDSVWNLTITAPQDITSAVLEENSFKDAPAEGMVLAGFSVDMTLLEARKEPLSQGFNFRWEIIGGATNAVYDSELIFGCGLVPNEFDGSKEVFVDGTLSGTLCMEVPLEDLESAETQVALNFTGGGRVHFGQ